MKLKAVVKTVEYESIAYDAGIEPGDIIDNINGKKFIDILDFKYLTSDEYYVVGVNKKDGSYEEIEIYNELYEQFGVEFENPLIDEPKRCHNKCIFCFMDQLPPNVRKTMVFKDDDVRLSFLQGNYVTLTNLTERDIQRIISLRISPINISVHATDGKVRKMMLNNKNADKVLDIMNRFAESGIIMNAQIVLCPGVNDGEVLKKSIEDLTCFIPALHSVSVVPVGISKHRKGLYELKSVTDKIACDVLDIVEEYSSKLYAEHGTRVVYAADEFYIMAKRDIPCFEAYEDFPQIENGVGMLAQLEHDIDNALDYQYEVDSSKKYLITGFIAYDYINKYVEKIKSKYHETNVEIIKIRNDFFGEQITVAGLVCGGDIINQLKGKNLDGALLVSRNMLKNDCPVFLDDVTVEDVSKELGVQVRIVENSGEDFVRACLDN